MCKHLHIKITGLLFSFLIRLQSSVKKFQNIYAPLQSCDFTYNLYWLYVPRPSSHFQFFLYFFTPMKCFIKDIAWTIGVAIIVLEKSYATKINIVINKFIHSTLKPCLENLIVTLSMKMTHVSQLTCLWNYNALNASRAIHLLANRYFFLTKTRLNSNQ